MKNKGILYTVGTGLRCITEIFPLRAEPADNWEKRMHKYQKDNKIDSIIFVKYKKKSYAEFYMYQKTETGWKDIVRCKAYVGKYGINKKREGDGKTPTGTYNFIMSFGLKKNPGAGISYIRLNRYLYWSSRRKDYNRLVDCRKETGVVGEHLVDYNPAYNYVLVLNYNKEGIYGKGSGIFLHCYGRRKYTLGCVAIPEKQMKIVLRNITKHTKICIYKK